MGLTRRDLSASVLMAAIIEVTAGSASVLEVLVGGAAVLWLTATLLCAFPTADPPDLSWAADARRVEAGGRFEVPIDADFPPEDTEWGPPTRECDEPAGCRYGIATR